jgi:hypothetical protein
MCDMDSAEINGLCDQVASLDATRIPRAELGQVALALERLRNVVNAADAAVLAEFHDEGSWALDGALSGAAWVAARTGTPLRDVRGRQHSGLGLRQLPAAAAAARTGRLSPDQQRRLADCARRHPALAQRDEGLLLDLAERLPVAAFATAALHWQAVAEDADEPEQSTVDRRAEDGPRTKVFLSDSLDGVAYVHAELRGDHRELVVAALDARFDQLLRARHSGDPSLNGYTAAELRGEALVDLLTQTQRREPSERSQPDRYRVGVIVHADGDPDHPATVSEAVARCDAPHFRAVLSAKGEVLDIGRQSDQWPVAIRRAITLRDSGCVFPGCDRPASWCDVHHCKWWSDQGKPRSTTVPVSVAVTIRASTPNAGQSPSQSPEPNQRYGGPMARSTR